MYEENFRVAWIWAVVVSKYICLAVFGWILWNLIEGQWQDETSGWISVVILGVVVVLLQILTMTFSRYTVQLEGGRLTFGYRYWHVTLPVEQIANAQQEEIVFRKWLGWGWRIDVKKRIGYIARLGPGVIVQTKMGRTYVLSCTSRNVAR